MIRTLTPFVALLLAAVPAVAQEPPSLDTLDRQLAALEVGLHSLQAELHALDATATPQEPAAARDALGRAWAPPAVTPVMGAVSCQQSAPEGCREAAVEATATAVLVSGVPERDGLETQLDALEQELQALQASLAELDATPVAGGDECRKERSGCEKAGSCEKASAASLQQCQGQGQCEQNGRCEKASAASLQKCQEQGQCEQNGRCDQASAASLQKCQEQGQCGQNGRCDQASAASLQKCQEQGQCEQNGRPAGKRIRIRLQRAPGCEGSSGHVPLRAGQEDRREHPVLQMLAGPGGDDDCQDCGDGEECRGRGQMMVLMRVQGKEGDEMEEELEAVLEDALPEILERLGAAEAEALRHALSRGGHDDDDGFESDCCDRDREGHGRWREEEEEYEFRGGPMPFRMRHPVPGPGGPEHAFALPPAHEEVLERLDRLEARMDRIERLLERLVEDRHHR